MNMFAMVVTWDVSKFSLWLNAHAYANMLSMLVTLDVSKLSGLLNFSAPAVLPNPPNMPLMSVTLEVSQLEISALKFVKPVKRLLMSVMAETSQSAMRPYVAVAAVGLALYAWTAVFREAVVVNVAGQVSEPQLEP